MTLISLLWGWSKLTWFSNAGRKSLVLSMSVLTLKTSDLIEFCVGGPNWLGFSVGDRTWLDSSVEWNWFGCSYGLSKMTSFQCGGSALISFSCGGRKSLVFPDRNYLSFVSGHRNRLDIRVGINLTWFQWWYRNQLDFYVRDRNWHGFSVGIELYLFFVRGQNRLRYCVLVENYLVSIYGSKLTCVFCVGIEINVGFVCGPKMTCF